MKPLQKKDLEKFKNLLIQIRSRIAGDLHHKEEDSLNKSQRDSTGDLSGYSLHMADQATDNFDYEFNLGLISNDQNVLNKIEASLRKIEDGSYGVCDGCEKRIPMKRLKVLPYTNLCIKCQEAEEQDQA